ncbi:hypothetical protein [Paraburkholderia saeva]|uniref:hypothetical protein n=1 Tax=Paraburkholderia saeva TaxID=2777537 RepID=UPI001D3E59F0|nr:hypothetical protein [Paraburkholderia saeva]CAG4924680.1 hypothetical protein R52603_05290 [Paraburkholderia saeva]
MRALTGNAPHKRPLAATLRAALDATKEANERLHQALVALLPDVPVETTQASAAEPVKTPPARGPPLKPGPLTTAELAADLGITQGTIRRRLCDTGSYFGVVPMKLASGRLLWPADSLQQLTRSADAKAAS